MNEKISIQFLGAAGTVTGSKYIIKALGKTLMIDCGLFQGLKELRLLNWNKLPINCNTIDVVLLTHGHLDHVGYLPRLVSQGFNKKILGTAPTLEITKIILQDSARIQEEDAERANRDGYSKHKPAEPLYNINDVEQTLSLFSPQPLNEWINLFDKISVRFRYNGHIIGATFIELKIANKVLVFSGDIGRETDPLLSAPQKPEIADILLIESTYGNKIHPPDPETQLTEVINNAVKKNGTIIIPSFAVERTQLLMYVLWQLKSKKAIPSIPIYMDSPMGKSVLDVFQHNKEWHKLTANDVDDLCKNIIYAEGIQDTVKIAAHRYSKIIIAASGMASGGRVLTYFQTYLDNPNTTILLVGYQAEGTRGRSLLEGAKEIKMYGKYYPVKTNIVNIQGLSAHADQMELLNWMNKIESKPQHIFILHGEKIGSEALKQKIREVYKWNSEIPELNQVTEISL